MSIFDLLIIASGLTATTYGYGEKNCGDIGFPVACDSMATTASGVRFVPTEAQVAIAAPTNLRIQATSIYLRVAGGPCKLVQLVDKMNPRYIGVRGFDLSPGAVELLTGQPASPRWSGVVHVCSIPYALVER